MPSHVKIDEVDISIIRGLQKDARTNFTDIARVCDLSIDTIIKRFRKLNRAGVVKGTTMLLNPRSFGYDCVASLEIDVDFPHMNEVVELVDKKPEVLFCTPSMGRHNIFAIAVLKDVGKLSQLRESIKGHPMVREVNASIWVDEILLCPENFEFDHIKE